jgi:hypothetical protein
MFDFFKRNDFPTTPKMEFSPLDFVSFNVSFFIRLERKFAPKAKMERIFSPLHESYYCCGICLLICLVSEGSHPLNLMVIVVLSTLPCYA